MITISKIFPSQADAIKALADANAGLVMVDKQSGATSPIATGAGSGARWDLFLTPLTAPGTAAVTIPGVAGAPDMTLPAPAIATGEWQVDLFWQGDSPAPAIAGGAASSALAVAFVPPPPVMAPAPEEISRRQFAAAAAMKGLITQAEAIGFVNTGALPAQVELALENPAMAAVQFDARMALASGTFCRHNPTTLQFLPLLGIDAQTADDVWRLGATIP